MLKEKTCCFTGHRAIEPASCLTIQKNLEKKISALIREGYIHFGSGGALGFDLLAADTVLSLKKLFPQIQLSMVLPCHDQDRYWSEHQRSRYYRVLSSADEVVYTSASYYKGCMFKRNRYLVDSADCVLAYLAHNSGGTKYTVDYANKTGVNVLFIQSQPVEQLSFLSL